MHPEQKLFPADAAMEDYFGMSVGLTGSVAIVGMPYDDERGQMSGSAWVLRMMGTTWVFEKKLLASDGATEEYFGSAVAVAGEVAAIGALAHVVNPNQMGAVYVYRNQANDWLQEAILTMPDSDRFGESVAMTDDRIVVGEPHRDFPGAIWQGTAYVFRYDGSDWNLEQQLVASDGATYDQFGTSVAIDGDWIIVGAPEDTGPGTFAGSVYLFHFDGTGWSEFQKIQPPDVAAFDYFGSAVAIDGDKSIVGAPGANEGSANAVGAAYVIRYVDGSWGQEAKLVPYDGAATDLFGAAVSISGNVVVASAPSRNDTAEASGSAYSFHWDGKVWTGQCKLVSGDLGVAATYDEFGKALSVCDGIALVASPADRTFFYGAGSVSFVSAFPDCNGNNIPDPCELPDCNGNRTPDTCDIQANVSEDCNGNGIPDECESPVAYQLDDGTVENTWGVTSAADIVWLNQFTVLPGHETVTFVDIEWQSKAPEGFPVTVMVYDDPNNDTNPDDAMLLSSFDTRSYDYATDNLLALGWARVQIPVTFVGSPEESFFIGVRIHSLPQNYSVVADTTPPSLGRSWVYFTGFGQSDIAHLQNNGLPSTSYGNFMLRAGTTDCNANGIFDGCDILKGTSADKNENGVPDECDACRADFMPQGGDGTIGLSDLLGVIAAWGTGQGNPADINADGTVNSADLLIVLNGWGRCP